YHSSILGEWEWERTQPFIEEFVNKSLFLVVELKQSIPRLFHSHPRIVPTVWGTVGSWKLSEQSSLQNCLGDSWKLEIERTKFATKLSGRQFEVGDEANSVRISRIG
ncbi:TPA: hypothetical protein ACGOWW_002186, partial [Streptococcus suis]